MLMIRAQHVLMGWGERGIYLGVHSSVNHLFSNEARQGQNVQNSFD